jgi:hypothetical protein
MSAQIIQLSDHRKVRTPAMVHLMHLSLSIFVAHLVIGPTFYAAVIEAAQEGFRALMLIWAPPARPAT